VVKMGEGAQFIGFSPVGENPGHTIVCKLHTKGLLGAKWHT